MLFSEYEGGGFKGGTFDWLEDKTHGAVEALVTSTSGSTVAIEHTLIQPFVGERDDSNRFLKAFLPIEKDASLPIPEKHINLSIPVGALPNQYDWSDIGKEVKQWFSDNRATFPEGESQHLCKVGATSRRGEFDLELRVNITSLPGMDGKCLIERHSVPETLDKVVDKALRTKLPKLTGTVADKHLLLLEREHVIFSSNQILGEIERQRANHPQLDQVEEIWFADTVARNTEAYVNFSHLNRNGLRQMLAFTNGRLTNRRDAR
jgi:hypothetical protein